MTGLVIHHCPKCELRFSFRTELEQHLSVDHRVSKPVEPAAVKVGEPSGLDVVPMAPPVARDRHGARSWRPHVVGLVLAFAAALLVAYTAVFVSVSTAVIVAVVLLALVGIYVRRARGWPRLPRR